MKLHYLTLDGVEDKEKFIEEWYSSTGRKSTFLQTSNSIYIEPTGVFSPITEETSMRKFTGTYRSHEFVARDFGLKKKDVVGGGYLALDNDRKMCSYVPVSEGFGRVPDVQLVVNVINGEFFGD